MDDGAQHPAVHALPIALTAVTVAGQCRERSPADQAIFGDAADRFVERFKDPELGQALLARSVSEGAAEGQAVLRTGAGPLPFRISLWRQRGGERIRVLAAFAMEPSASGRSDCGLSPALLSRFGNDLRAPVNAVIGLAERLRNASGDTPPGAISDDAGDIVAASWRLMRLADDLDALREFDAAVPPLRIGELDLARLARRLFRLARPLADASGTELRSDDLAAAAPGAVLADESTMWSAIERLLQLAISHAGKGGEVTGGLSGSAAGQGIVLTIAARPAQAACDGAAPAVAEHDEADEVADLAAVNGAAFELDPEPDGALIARIAFPAARCLPAP